MTDSTRRVQWALKVFVLFRVCVCASWHWGEQTPLVSSYAATVAGGKGVDRALGLWGVGGGGLIYSISHDPYRVRATPAPQPNERSIMRLISSKCSPVTKPHFAWTSFHRLQYLYHHINISLICCITTRVVAIETTHSHFNFIKLVWCCHFPLQNFITSSGFVIQKLVRQYLSNILLHTRCYFFDRLATSRQIALFWRHFQAQFNKLAATLVEIMGPFKTIRLNKKPSPLITRSWRKSTAPPSEVFASWEVSVDNETKCSPLLFKPHAALWQNMTRSNFVWNTQNGKMLHLTTAKELKVV